MTVSDPLNSVDPKAADWLDKDFFKVEKPQIDFLCLHQRRQFLEPDRAQANPARGCWRNSKPGEVLDTNKVSSLASTLSYPSFVDVAADAAPDKTGLDKPLAVTIDDLRSFHLHAQDRPQNAGERL